METSDIQVRIRHLATWISNALCTNRDGHLLQMQPLRASKISRLPGPAVHAGLSELSDSQHNARAQSSIPAPPGLKSSLKREIPQPGTIHSRHGNTNELHGANQLALSTAPQPDPKRKPLADRAAEYPAPASASAASKIAVKGQTLSQVRPRDVCDSWRYGFFQFIARNMVVQNSNISSQLKRSTRHTTNTPAQSFSTFTKSYGQGRNQPDRSNPTSFRSSHARSKSQAARPRTAHGHRPDEQFDEPTSANGMMRTPIPVKSVQNIELRHMQSMPFFPRGRESSLTASFKSLSINDNSSTATGCRVASRHENNATSSSSNVFVTSNVTIRARKVESQVARHASMET